MSSVGIRTTRVGAVLTLNFDRPERKNAITAAMYQALADALCAAEQDDAVRAIVIAGHPEVFTAGNDLEDFMKNPPSDPRASVFQFLHAISTASKPLVAAVSGMAVGIGTTLLQHCDMVYASEKAKFSLPFTQLGLCAEGGSSLLLVQMAGYHGAAEKLLLGETFSAEEAVAMGLVNRIVPSAELHDFVAQQAAKLASLPANSLRVTKRLMKQGQAQLLQQAMANEAAEFAHMLLRPEAQEAFTAFFEKRKPDFTRLA